MTRHTLNRMNALSQELYGNTATWQKIYKKGLLVLESEGKRVASHHKAKRFSKIIWLTIPQIYKRMLKEKRKK